jgi:hypothetical protein
MKYKVLAKHHLSYEDASAKYVRYSLVIGSGEPRFIDCSVSLYMAAKIGLDIEIPRLPTAPLYIDLTEPSIPDIL